MRHDIVHTVVGQGFGNQLGEAIVAGVLAVSAGWAGSRLDLAPWPASWPLALQVLVGVLLADGLEYARHRASHRYDWLWRIHALHHSVDRMHVLKSGRGHFIDMVLRHLTVFLPLALIGTPTTILLAYVAAVTVLGGIGHSNVDMWLPGFLHRLVMTPHVHRIHHARDGDLALANYANVFPLWDVLFGTFSDPARVRLTGFGIEHDTMPASLWGQIRVAVRAAAQRRAGQLTWSTRSPRRSGSLPPFRSLAQRGWSLAFSGRSPDRARPSTSSGTGPCSSSLRRWYCRQWPRCGCSTVPAWIPRSPRLA